MYFEVKNDHLKAFLGKKRDFTTFSGQTVIFGHFGSKRVNFGQFSAIFSHFEPVCDILAKPPCRTLDFEMRF